MVLNQRSEIVAYARRLGTQHTCAQYYRKTLKLYRSWEVNKNSRDNLTSRTTIKLGQASITTSIEDPNITFSREIPQCLGLDQQEDEEEEIVVEQESEATEEVQKKASMLKLSYPNAQKFLKELYTSKRRLKGPLKRINVIIQLVDRSLVQPKGVLEDVLVQLNELMFPAYFYLLDMGDNDSLNSNFFFGDVYDVTFSMEFDDEVINFNIYDAMYYPGDVVALNFIDVIKPLTAEYFEITYRESLALVSRVLSKKYVLDKQVKKTVAHMDLKKKHRYDNQILKLPDSNSKKIPSILQAPILELKTLPEHLKYTFLEEKETLPVIISNKLSEKEESELIGILKPYKNALRWTIADIKGINSSLCMHKILMEEDFKASRKAQ
uniref:Uncharacterized protein n=1 Tax=Lactuca sativa TaxID=4236 RepID=A0A9R1X784_LACSA|nr:hypothetical protein LSAT_V11C600318740 [Lactuca sativa]